MRQRNFTPTISDKLFDELIAKLKDAYGIEKLSELITRLVVDAAKKS